MASGGARTSPLETKKGLGGNPTKSKIISFGVEDRLKRYLYTGMVHGTMIYILHSRQDLFYATSRQWQ